MQIKKALWTLILRAYIFPYWVTLVCKAPTLTIVTQIGTKSIISCAKAVIHQCM